MNHNIKGYTWIPDWFYDEDECKPGTILNPNYFLNEQYSVYLTLSDVFNHTFRTTTNDLEELKTRHILEVEIQSKIHPTLTTDSRVIIHKSRIVRELTQADILSEIIKSATNHKFDSNLLIYLLLKYPETPIAPAFVCLFPEQTQMSLARFASPQVCRLLIQSPYPLVRERLILRNVLSIEELNPFVYDPSINVRSTLAQYGTDSHRKQLAESKDTDTRLSVLPYANSELIDTMLETETDASVLVYIFKIAKTKQQRKQAKQRLKTLHNVTITNN